MKARKIETSAEGFEAQFFGYRDEILGELIEEAKYESTRGLIAEIAEVVYSGFFKMILDKGKKNVNCILVPMPTNRQHVRERAMDHMDMIVREIEQLSGGRIQRVRLLERAKDTVQMGASEAVRKKQAKEAVKLNVNYLTDKKKLAPEFEGTKIYLIDDVWTTGASLREAGKILRKCGANDLTLIAITKSRAKKSPTLRHGEIY